MKVLWVRFCLLLVLISFSSSAAAGEIEDKLREAAKLGQINVVRALLAQGADVNAKGTSGESALAEAAFTGNADIALVLLERGAEVNSKDKYGNTALMCAAFFGNTNVVSLLLNHGADIHAKANSGDTALLLAAKFEGREDLVRVLLDGGADVSAKDQEGFTALLAAAHAGKTEVVRFLLDRGAKVNAECDNNGYTALMWAALAGKAGPVKVLLDRGADINLVNAFGDTALSLASGKPDVVVLLNFAKMRQAFSTVNQDTIQGKNGLDGVMGIPWGAAPQDVRKVMEKNGFKFWREDNDPLSGDIVTYSDGLFAGYSVSGFSCVFLANKLYMVSVSISEKRANIDSAYSDIGHQLANKYGDPGPEKSYRIPVNCPPNKPYENTVIQREWSIVSGGKLPHTIQLKKTPAWFCYEKYLGGIDVTYTNNALRETLKAESRQGI